ncbi:hypothetical protein SAMN05519103_01945 [Rhizobiales bacterium GAS113]|nr:hypothetical protein SAMN05519103_01945 [Rhizobiales bacterium GAS113]
MPYWSCAQLQPCRTQLALHFLELNGFEPYAPRIRTAARKNGHDGSTWLFPAYGFIRITDQWHRAQRAPGVLKVLLHNGCPAKIADHVISALRARENGDGLIELAPPPPPLRRGISVRIVAGPFADQVAHVERLKPHERVEILLTWLGSPRPLILPRAHIAAIPGHSLRHE